ncbi:MAG: hypothetical protein QHH05_02545 [Syntrophomonadaceae bacterium]|jgi:hypothetical protein|nr:hypothetical protein [Syntrophomonadaceae bacterium]
MTKLQLIFLMVTIAYLMVKGVLFYIMYLVTLQIEAAALARQAKMRAYLSKVRAEDRERFREAYQWYQKRLGSEAGVPADVPSEPVAEPARGTRMPDPEVLREAYQWYRRGTAQQEVSAPAL